MKRLFLTILCGVGLNLNLATADTTTNLPNAVSANSTPAQTNQNLQSETKIENITNQNLLSELDAQTLKELEKYDRNLHNTPKTEQEKVELEKLIEAIVNVDYDKTKEILDNNPNLVNLNLEFFVSPIGAFFYSQKHKADKIFDEKIFELLMNHNPKLYTNDLVPFMVVMNESIDDNRTIKLLQIMQKEGLDLNIEYPKFLNAMELPIYLITEALATKKFNTMEFLIKNDAKSPVYDGLGMLMNSIITDFFKRQNLKINSSEPLKIEQKKLTKSIEYENVKSELFRYINLYLQNDGDISTLVFVEIDFKYLGDTDGLERLKKLGYKEICDNYGKNCDGKKINLKGERNVK